MSVPDDPSSATPGAGGGGEFALIARLGRWLDRAGPGLLLGTGDDAAVLAVPGDVAIAVDALVEGRHFDRSFSSLADVGWKSVAVNVSDLAAVGATPVTAVVALFRPTGVTVSEVEDLYRGMRAAADHWGMTLIGGDTVAADTLAVAVTVLGSVDEVGHVTRGGASPGEAIVVVGVLGVAAAGLALHHAGFDVPEPLARAHRRPEALPAAGRILAREGATAMIDVSDGFGADLGHLCAASRVGARVTASALPVVPGVAEAAARLGVDPLELAVSGGDDYALVATVPVARVEAIMEALGPAVPVCVVGTTTQPRDDAPAYEPLLCDGGRCTAIGRRGYDHYEEAGE